MLQTRTHRGPRLGLALAAALLLAVPLPASASPAIPAAAPSPSIPATGDGAVVDTLVGIAPSGDQEFSPDIPTASSALTARDLARETGQRVEVLDERTTISSTYALPDGSWEVAQSGAPEWAQTSGDGTHAADWESVDPRLAENGDGSYSPNAHPQRVVVNGGNGEFFRMSDPETGLAISLSIAGGPVPTPVVDGTRATFSEIARDTDLVLEIRPAGYEYFLVLKTPAAARASADVPLVLTMSGATMSPDGSGGFTLVGVDGEAIGTMPPPVAWDAHSDLKRGSPVLDGWSPVQEFAPVTRALKDLAPAERVSTIRDFLASGADLQAETIVDVSQALTPAGNPGTFGVELAVPEEWIADTDTQYPLVLDPSGEVGTAFDTFVQQWYTSDQSSSTELKLGTYDNGLHSARSFLSFQWVDLQYTSVSSARLNLWEWHSWSCSPRGWHAFLASAADSSTRWSAQPWFGSPYGTSYETLGFSSSCNDGWVGVDITNIAQVWSAYQPGTYHSVALAAESTASSYYWKRFNSFDAGWNRPYVSVTFTATPPKAPTDITVGGEVLTAAHRTDFTEKRPEFRAFVEDIPNPPTGGAVRNLHAVFVLYKDGSLEGTYDGSTVAPGNYSTYTPTFDLEEGANYTLYVATEFNGSTVSEGIQGGGTFTTTSQRPAAASGLRLNSLLVPSGVAQGDGSATGISTPLQLSGLRELIEVGDANGDGKPDLLVWGTDYSLGLLLGDGAGGVQSATPTPVSGNWVPYTRILAPGDFNGDSLVDLITMDAAGNLYLSLGDGAGAFAAPGAAIGIGWQGFRDILTPGDMDKDGKNDLIAFTTTGNLQLYRGDGSGGFLSPAPIISTGGQAFTEIVTPGDFNVDSYDARDLVGWVKPTGRIQFYWGLGSGGTFTGGTIISTAWADFMKVYAPGDFTGDGKSDLMGQNADGTLTLVAGDGNGGISPVGTVVGVTSPAGSTLASRGLDDSTPSFSAVVSDPDGGLVRAVFSLYRRRAGDATWELVRNDLYGSWVTSGQRSYFRSTASSNDPGLEAALLAGNDYRIEVRSQDKALSSETALTTGVLTLPPPVAAPDVPAGCDTISGTPSGTSTTC